MKGKRITEMTRGEYTAMAGDLAQKTGTYQPPWMHKRLQELHRSVIEQALADGGAVSLRVLKDYPDLIN